MSLVQQIRQLAATELSQKDSTISTADITVNETKPEFEGDYTIVLFSLLKKIRTAPEQLGKELGEALVKNHGDLFQSYNVIKGFLNLSISQSALLNFLQTDSAKNAKRKERVMVEYSSPNTNKPLHLGHLRNNFLGWSIARICYEAGFEVMKSCIVNDRGIHICKSMIAWQQLGNGETPQSVGMKGDHFVGAYYVKFNDLLSAQKKQLVEEGMSAEEAEKSAPIMKEAQQMLVDWENGKPEVIDLWKKMNGWVYEGFDVTYKRIGSDFDKTYYESNTYLLGRKFVEEGLSSGVFFKKEDGSVWIDLTDEGLDQKLVLRRDGTSVYITQDLGLADQKYSEFRYDKSIYVIADEQNYHMKVLQLILKKLGKPYAEGIHHLSYGMVELPTGRMKSREGTVVDADDLMDEMVKEAASKTTEKSKVEEFSSAELNELYEQVALGALKFFLLKVDPKKKMVFNPEESIDFHGFTGPFIQYTHARLRSILRKGGEFNTVAIPDELQKLERELILLLEQYVEKLEEAVREYNPATIANYVYALAKTCNSFYSEHTVLKAEDEKVRAFRLLLCSKTAAVIKICLELLGIKAPERM